MSIVPHFQVFAGPTQDADSPNIYGVQIVEWRQFRHIYEFTAIVYFEDGSAWTLLGCSLRQHEGTSRVSAGRRLPYNVYNAVLREARRHSEMGEQPVMRRRRRA